jgi:hypothetical protein
VHLFPVECGYVLGTPVEEDLLDPPSALPGVSEVQRSFGPDNVTLHSRCDVNSIYHESSLPSSGEGSPMERHGSLE